MSMITKDEPALLPINATIGVDLGQAADYTAIVVVERLERIRPGPNRVSIFGDDLGLDLEDVHVVRHVERCAIGTPYPEQVRQVARLLRTRTLAEAEVVIDRTGVGRGVFDLFVEAYRRGDLGEWWPKGMTITAGHDAQGRNVPKRQLISRMVAAAQTGRLLFPAGVPLADQVKHELKAFSIKVSASGHDTYEALRERDHDDIVLATAMALYWRHNRTVPRGITGDGEVVDRNFHA